MSNASYTQNGITPMQQMTASATGAILTSFFMTPLDVVKIRLQVQQKPFAKGQCFLYCNGLMDHLCTCLNGNSQIKPWYKLPSHFNGTLDAFIKIGRNEGVTSLWSGLPPTLLMAVPATMIYFTAYDQLKMFLGFGRKNAAAVWWIPMSAGIIARIGAVSVINPLELIRTKMQSKALTYTELKNCVKTAIAQDGWLSLWRGLAPTLLRDVPFSAMYWTNYEIFKSVLCTRCELREPTLAISFASGAVSGMIAGVMTMPFDVVKTHRQTELGEKNIPGKQMPTSTLSIMKKIYRERGTRGLFAGMTPRIIRVAPACAIMISSYELMKSFFRKRNLRLLENG